MKTSDWVLAVIFVGLMAAAGWMILPIWGAFGGGAFAAFLLYRAKLRRDHLTQPPSEQ